ncbi:fucolectin-1-like [Gigantopelta aegis]|uniref:fucolectin-1-like n=1 Tax=Gigantopelta aegis TaxID=1735272 RepID=UPI001B88D819|nr:fucolectin-1-like [Gigantopelta aegis]
MRELFTCGCLLLLCCIKGIIGEDPVLFHGRGRKNWALRRRTYVSTTYSHLFVSSNAVDGRLSNDAVKSHSCIHTTFERQPWWIVDLGKIIRVKEVYIMNRGDCCGGFLLLYWSGTAEWEWV